MTQQNLTILNVAEKPSVARALAGVFSRLPQSRDRGVTRDTQSSHQVFTHESVMFPYVYSQAQAPMEQHNRYNNNRGGVGGPSTAHKMITTSVRGHLASMEFGPQFGWSRCDPSASMRTPGSGRIWAASRSVVVRLSIASKITITTWPSRR